MNSADLRAYFQEAQSSMESARACAKVAVGFAAGKLRSMYIDADTLRELKHELQGFNAKKGKWAA